jgi:hypothetical protein
MAIVRRILSERPYHEIKHPEFGTLMRMMDKELAFSLLALPAGRREGGAGATGGDGQGGDNG